MRRYVCTVATGLLLALASTGTATAALLPLPDPLGAQEAVFGDQSVGEQLNDAVVTQAQGNGNVNVSPAIAIFGDAKTENEQGNDNKATVDIDQANAVEQSQSSTQESLGKVTGGCCDGQSRIVEQITSFGDQSVGKQRNESDVDQFQGNGNLNVSPAIAIFGDAKTENEQGNNNKATVDIDQSNTVEQTQSSTQKQRGSRKGGCCDGQSRIVEQITSFGDQSVGEQLNDAVVTQAQGNGNVSVSPAIAIFGDANTENEQGNDNKATVDIDQSNAVEQSQSSTQKQRGSQAGERCCSASSKCKAHDYSCGKNGKDGKNRSCCDRGSSQTAEQKAEFGDQSVGEQRNEATVVQKQGNGNVSLAPALSFGKGKGTGKGRSCSSKCGKPSHSFGGDAETRNEQGNGNKAAVGIDQSNAVDQSQRSYQSLVDRCKELIA